MRKNEQDYTKMKTSQQDFVKRYQNHVWSISENLFGCCYLWN